MTEKNSIWASALLLKDVITRVGQTTAQQMRRSSRTANKQKKTELLNSSANEFYFKKGGEDSELLIRAGAV